MTAPNVVFIMSDDHAAHAIGAYGSAINTTPGIDRLASQGVVFENCFCTNALCAPSRAAILTGTHNHINGVRTLSEQFDSSQPSFPPILREAGYRNALIGKWHLGHGPGHDPEGFEYWRVLDGQGEYLDPFLLGPDGPEQHTGHATDVITDLALAWLRDQSAEQPFCLLVHHKAPHRPFTPADRHASLFTEQIPEPSTFRDDYANRAAAAAAARMRIGRDLTADDLKEPEPAGLNPQQRTSWAYQRFIADYLRCVAGVDESVAAIIETLDAMGLGHDTIVVYTSDQGFFLGDHGWYDKRFMFEESLRMPLIVRYPPLIEPGTRREELVSNVDFAPTILDLAGLHIPERVQGRSLRGPLSGSGEQLRDAVYYRYWEHDDNSHGVWAHYGVRTEAFKLIYYYAEGLGIPGTSDRRFEPEWELFDLRRDPDELHNRYHDPEYASVRAGLHQRLDDLMAEVGDTPPVRSPAPGSPR